MAYSAPWHEGGSPLPLEKRSEAFNDNYVSASDPGTPHRRHGLERRAWRPSCAHDLPGCFFSAEASRAAAGGAPAAVPLPFRVTPELGWAQGLAVDAVFA